MGLFGVAALAAPVVAHAAPLDLFVERVAISAADSRCGLFTPDVGQALAVGVAQARGAALRAGVPSQTLISTERTARARAAAADCNSPDLNAAADRVRNAFDGYAGLMRLSYPGDFGTWKADRIPSRKLRWRLQQETPFGRDRLQFGLVGDDRAGALMAVARFADGQTPYGARLVLRDATRTYGPYLDRYYGGPTASLPLTRRLPPDAAQRVFLAEARSPAGQDLLPAEAKDGWAFRFPPQAARYLAALDPRDAVVVEFLFQGGAPRRAYVEVGDFAAGRAFLQVTRSPTQLARSAQTPPSQGR